MYLVMPYKEKWFRKINSVDLQRSAVYRSHHHAGGNITCMGDNDYLSIYILYKSYIHTHIVADRCL